MSPQKTRKEDWTTCQFLSYRPKNEESFVAVREKRVGYVLSVGTKVMESKENSITLTPGSPARRKRIFRVCGYQEKVKWLRIESHGPSWVLVERFLFGKRYPIPFRGKESQKARNCSPGYSQRLWSFYG
ncbi:hypothetical protein MPNT_10054 [Candidatus Methylacidithermus pantelleriae]|uniref:Uncharacterized protein n=1 Tax=Candidatus Methylacidithermus pantelleriae TaxID=2744239 RepID=A0A8J2BFG5_9BACT|nr:hypothetical protein MPNT_10054 [Candidatus Methylacidithermus pantelleriae]